MQDVNIIRLVFATTHYRIARLLEQCKLQIGQVFSVYCITSQDKAFKNFVRTTGSGPDKHCNLKNAECTSMEENLFKWHLKQKDKNVLISAYILRSKIYGTKSGFNANANASASATTSARLV